ncbi:STAS domain-containing protein [Actinacidiphila sp. DG2A-62]|uniref:STAS domain-containing protein n=1 Tax=Actinacidiphila sp. DG2A-62 TaxID=3108821 RepID=UPI002DB83C24|nr:STAS domain-containing protein [Actinacidiphila sp. DG2A-62]MEC3998473.1 STAS domain-containing protein [Actinacidiphila sp. DG2A-62]
MGVALTPPAARTVRDLRGRLVIRLTEDGGRSRAALTGEIDLDNVPMLRDALGDSLRLAEEGLDVDLSGVRFLDCSGLNVLLALRRTAAAYGCDLRMVNPSGPVSRLLMITGTQALLTAASAPTAAQP